MLRNKIYCCLTQKCVQMTACVFVFLSAILWFIFLLTARPDMLHPFKYVCVKYFYLFSMHNTHNNSFRHTKKTITVYKAHKWLLFLFSLCRPTHIYLALNSVKISTHWFYLVNCNHVLTLPPSLSLSLFALLWMH